MTTAKITEAEITGNVRTLCEESLHRLPLLNETTLAVSLPETGKIGPLYDLLGEELKTLLISDQSTGFRHARSQTSRSELRA